MSLSRKQKFLIPIAVILILIAVYVEHCRSTKLCTISSLGTLIGSHTTVWLPIGSIEADVADTPSSREAGLSGVTSLPQGRGMLFIFDQPGRYGFWMKDMLFPLDIIWISENGVVVHLEKDVTPSTYPKTFINTKDALYVLEISAGGAKDHGITLGTRIRFSK